MITTEGEDVAATTSEKPLTASQTKPEDKWFDKLAALFETLCESNDQIRKSKEEKGWAENLPPYIQPEIQAILAKIESKFASQNLLDMNLLISEAIVVLRRASFFIEIAKSVGSS